jgi:hypothetical protein
MGWSYLALFVDALIGLGSCIEQRLDCRLVPFLCCSIQRRVTVLQQSRVIKKKMLK